MVLEVEIDRGDVWRDDERPRTRPVDRRPALTLFAVHPGGRVALVRWLTTIGGWNDEKLGSGEVVQRWKESPAGPVVWRDLYLAPTWLPPDTTPDRELVRYRDGRHELARESMGPSYRSAYGLVMLIHHQVVAGKGGLRFVDDGVRAHGSSRVGSLADGRSHGCHRLCRGRPCAWPASSSRTAPTSATARRRPGTGGWSATAATSRCASPPAAITSS
ncbi:MAG: hypothetical protein HS111_14020 [Kofleriaceae bacterium]|nr:hypothetical protein [Kofleriaceae bacterium]